MREDRSRAVLWRAALLVAFLIAAVTVGLIVPLPAVEEIRGTAATAGFWGGAAFAVGYAAVTLTPIPKNIASIAAGIVWGLGGGVAIVYAGALLGAAGAFVLGRWLGRDAVERFTGARVARVDALLHRNGLSTLLAARLIPVLPFTVLNYAAGLTGVRRRDYAVSTAIGIIPGTVAYVAVGAYGATLSWGFYVAIAALGVLSLIGGWVGHRARRRSRPAARDAGDGAAEDA